jgi:hypothetical protein
MKTTWLLSVTTTLAVLGCALQTRLEAQAASVPQGGSAAAMSAESIKGFQNAVDLPGGDAGTKIRNAIQALPAAGGVVDARGFSGTVPINGNLAAGIPPTKAVTVLLGAATFVLASDGAQQVFAVNRFSLVGSSITNTVLQFSDPTQDIFVVPNSNSVGTQVSISNMTIEPAPGVKRTGGNILRYGGNNGVFQNLRLIDAWQGIFIQNAFQTMFDNIEFLTTRAGTLNYGLFLYGYDVDDFFHHIYGDSNHPIGDAFIHTRNWVTGMHYSDIEWQDDEGGTGLHFDCGSSPEAPSQDCGNGPNGRPEITRFDQAYIESGPTQSAILMQGAQDIRFQNSYFASSRSIRIQGESTAVSIDNSFIGNMIDQCVVVATRSAGGPGKADLSITNSEINLCSQGNGAAPAITLMPGVSNVSIQGNRIGNNTYPQLNAHESPYGIQLSGNNNNIRIIGNDFISQIGGRQVLVKPILLQGTPGKDNVFFANTPADAASNVPGVQNFPDGINVGGSRQGITNADHLLRFVGSVTTTGANSDSLQVTGMTASGHCEQQAGNAPAAAMVLTAPGVYTSTGAGSVTLHHPAASGATFTIFCSFD